MALNDLRISADRYARDGFLAPVNVLALEEAAKHRVLMEWAEKKAGPLHYRTKVHTILRSPLALATDSRVLDLVAALIGPNILIYNVTYTVKEAGSPAHVSWHQDLTYWGFDGDAQVSMWLALSVASMESGCMRMVPGSHLNGRLDHRRTDDPANVLFQGQTVPDAAEGLAVPCPLEPGQASFHHGWTLHASLPNMSTDRRIGLNVQYVAPSMRQTKHELDSAMLVRGEDRYGHFRQDRPAEMDLAPDAMERQLELERLHLDIAITD